MRAMSRLLPAESLARVGSVLGAVTTHLALVTLLLTLLLTLPVIGCAPGNDGPATDQEIATQPSDPVVHRAPFEDGEVAYLEAGEGPTVALVHGWASDRRVWRRQVEALADRLRLLAIDLPGHGESDRPADPDGYSMDLFARSVAAVLDHAGAERAILIGHSNGTPVIRQFSRLYPERTAALVVVDGALRQMFDAGMVEGMLEQIQPDSYRDFVGTMVDGMKTPSLAPALFEEIRSMAVATSYDAVIGNFLAAAEPSIWVDDAIEAPLLAVLARQPAWSDEYEAHVRELQPEVEYVVLDDVSHFLMMERPEEFHRILLGFLEDRELLADRGGSGAEH